MAPVDHGGVRAVGALLICTDMATWAVASMRMFEALLL